MTARQHPARPARTHAPWAAALLLFLLAAATAPAAAADTDPPTHDAPTTLPATAVWLPWPIVHTERTPARQLAAIHPLFSVFARVAPHAEGVDVVWPFIRWRYEEQTHLFRDKYTFQFFPLFFHRTGTHRSGERTDQFLIPLYWRGGDNPGGGYFVLFPFIWYADGTRVSVPLFPPRPQRFAALWPLAGEFRGFWNRDLIQFVLWPLLVRSSKGTGEERVVTQSFLWPFFAVHTGPQASGFRAWPLAGYAQRDGTFKRGYFLWPLGHYRNEPDPPNVWLPQQATLFFPFFGRMRGEKLDFDMVTPMYGRIATPSRTFRGYVLALYRQNDDHRNGARRHHLLWFIFSWTTGLPIAPEFEADAANANPNRGWGFFPFYYRRAKDDFERLYVLFPFYQRTISTYGQREYARTYYWPFYYRAKEKFTDEPDELRSFFWPFYRYWNDGAGREVRNFPHLLPYAKARPIDRNWAPLWTLYGEEKNPPEGYERKSLAGAVWTRQEISPTAEHRSFRFLAYRNETTEVTGGETPTTQKRWDVLWGLAGREHIDGDGRWILFGKRL